MPLDINKKRIEVEERYRLRLRQRNMYPVCIKELNKDYALFMRILDLYEKHSLPEIANLTGLSEDALEHRLYHGKFPKSFQLIRVFDRKLLLARKANFHKVYLKSIASADGRKEAMGKDLADFDKGIELLLNGKNYRTCTQEMPRFSTVYDWILQRNLPWSFRDRNVEVEFKKINTDRLSESSNFAYLLGVYQAKVASINPDRLTITTNEPSLAREVENCFNALHMKPSRKLVDFSNSGHAERIYYDSSRLMSYISEITENNTRIPHSFFLPNLMIAYLSGFFDARASPHHSESKSKCSSIIRKYPRIVITKKGNVPLLSAVDSALNFIGIASNYDSQKNPSQIYINELKSIKKVIDLGLFRSCEQMDKLKELYDYWKDTNELDRNGKYQVQKNKIVLERLKNDAGKKNLIKTKYDKELVRIDKELIDFDEKITCSDDEIIEEDF